MPERSPEAGSARLRLVADLTLEAYRRAGCAIGVALAAGHQVDGLSLHLAETERLDDPDPDNLPDVVVCDGGAWLCVLAASWALPLMVRTLSEALNARTAGAEDLDSEPSFDPRLN